MRFEVLGPLSVTDDGEAINVTPLKWRILLAMLLRYANKPVLADLLVDALWGERPPRSARANLRVYIHRLRQTLGGDGRIAWVASGYTVAVCPGELDAHRFTELVEQGRAAREAGNAVAAGTLLRDALRLWRGPAYEGLTEECPPLRDEAARLEELRLTALQQRLAIDLDTGRHDELMPELRTLIADHPLREGFRAQLMIALYRSGRQAEALQAYRDTWQVFTGELGIEPSPQLRKLERAILTNDPSLNDPAPCPYVTGSATLGVVPQQLPPDVPGFTGRADELAHLDGLLPGSGEPGDRRGIAAIALVTGTAGVGKTAVVVHWAQRVHDHFPDGVLFADLRGYGCSAPPAQPDEVLERFLRALEVPPAAGPTTLEERAALFRTQLSRRRMLIVLDNAASSQQVRWLLPGSASCAVVVTSRSRLSGLVARNGARRIPLALLSPAAAVALLRQVITPARVDAEPAATAELARLCANLPLALRLAAERVGARPHLTLADLVRELANDYDRLNLLTAADDDATAVRAALSWSYRALPAEPARVFRLLGLHPGPDLSLAAVGRLVGADEHRARESLRTLTDVHLVQETSQDRYQLHDLLRAYAVERARADEPAGERDAAVRRVLDWYLYTADAADRILMPQRRRVPLDARPAGRSRRPTRLPSRGAALKWCEEERLNLVAAIRYAAETDHHDVAWKIPVALWGYFNVGGRWGEWLASHELGIAAARRGKAHYGEALLLISAANAYRDAGRYPVAFDRLDRAIVLSRQIGEPSVEAAACTLLCVAHRDLGELGEAWLRCDHALGLFRAHDDSWGSAWALYMLGQVCQDLGLHDQAIDHSQQALTLFESIDDEWGRARTLSLIGHIYRILGRHAEATKYSPRALTAARHVSDQDDQPIPL